MKRTSAQTIEGKTVYFWTPETPEDEVVLDTMEAAGALSSHNAFGDWRREEKGRSGVLEKAFSRKQSRRLGDKLYVDWAAVDFEQFHQGVNVELEHRDVTAGDPVKTAKIALAHLKEKADYYSALAKMEKARRLEGRTEYRGLAISVETRRGSIRQWHDPHSDTDGMTRMRVPYGYIRGTIGMDGDHVDCFVGPHHDAPDVYLVNQVKAPEFTEPDEQKVVLGVRSEAEAKAIYLQHYNDPRFFGSITALPFAEFRRKVLATPQGNRIIKAMTHILRRKAP